MSANVFWKPVRTTRKELYVMAPSAFRSSMEEVFGEYPDQGRYGWELDKAALPALYGMLAMTNNRNGDENPYMQMIAAIQKYSKINVWLEY